MMQPGTTSHVHHYHQSPPTNAFGLVGFILSLAGFVFGGLLCPLGLIFSVIGMKREPKGFAIAGLVIGIIGTVFLLFMVVYVVFIIFMIGGVVTAGVHAANQHHMQMQMQMNPPVLQGQMGVTSSSTTSWSTVSAANQGIMMLADTEVQNHYARFGQLPDQPTAQSLLIPFTDAQGNAVQYQRINPNEFELRLPGPDGQYNTPDDETTTIKLMP
jgi:hypothetical protein